MANEHPDGSSPTAAIQVWTDPRLLFMWIMPLGTLVWAGAAVFLAIFPFIYFQRELPELENKIAFAVASFFGVLVSSYYVYGNFQVLFLELRERFIAWRLTWDGAEFQLWGYYFKRASFHPGDVTGVERVILSERWLQRRIGSFLSRDTRFTRPHGKHINLRITLADGRAFYLPGEMGREKRWMDEDVVELREWMEGLAAGKRDGEQAGQEK